MESRRTDYSESKGFVTTMSRVRFTSSAPDLSAEVRSPRKNDIRVGTALRIQSIRRVVR